MTATRQPRLLRSPGPGQLGEAVRSNRPTVSACFRAVRGGASSERRIFSWPRLTRTVSRNREQVAFPISMLGACVLQKLNRPIPPAKELPGSLRRCPALAELMTMRTRKPLALRPSILLEVASHALMGVAFGLGFAFVLTHLAPLGIGALIDQSVDPQNTLHMLVVTCVTTFGIGAMSTGIVLMTMKDRE